MRGTHPILVAGLLLGGLAPPVQAGEERLPWRDAGLTERQAAAHLLDRFAFGPRPADVDRVVDMGLERWLEKQLEVALQESALDQRLAPLRTLGMSVEEMIREYPPPGLVRAELLRSGQISPLEGEAGAGRSYEAELRRVLREHYRENGYRPQRELVLELLAQKLVRAVYAENQLREVLTDFWFNHFHVSITDQEVRPYILAYERDAIRPHVLETFGGLLASTARHPAMLLYLDNARSRADAGRDTALDRSLASTGHRGRRGQEALRRRRTLAGDSVPRGLNENYARELLELHTLGADGGYDQEDVIEVARALTGWTVLPLGPARERVAKFIQTAGDGSLGFVRDGEFYFSPEAHDAERKQVLDKTLAAGRGMEDGEDVLDLLAHHPSTARHVARKLAVRFVADDPPPTLVDRLAKTFRRTAGDLTAVLRELAYAPEFWAAEARGQKIKSPFELVASALRALDAELESPEETLRWIARMGQPLYGYSAPTGFPDRAAAWISSGALIMRMNFGLQLASGGIGGVLLDLPSLVEGAEPESLDAILEICARRILPERDLAQTLALLAPVVRDAGLTRKATGPRPTGGSEAGSGATGSEDGLEVASRPTTEAARKRRPVAASAPTEAVSPVAYAAGVIIGSPEFQRR